MYILNASSTLIFYGYSGVVKSASVSSSLHAIDEGAFFSFKKVIFSAVEVYNDLAFDLMSPSTPKLEKFRVRAKRLLSSMA